MFNLIYSDTEITYDRISNDANLIAPFKNNVANAIDDKDVTLDALLKYDLF